MLGARCRRGFRHMAATYRRRRESAGYWRFPALSGGARSFPMVGSYRLCELIGGGWRVPGCAPGGVLSIVDAIGGVVRISAPGLRRWMLPSPGAAMHGVIAKRPDDPPQIQGNDQGSGNSSAPCRIIEVIGMKTPTFFSTAPSGTALPATELVKPGDRISILAARSRTRL